MSSFRMTTYTVTQSAAGPSVPTAILPNAQNVPAGILTILSPGAVLTYNIEVTGDDPFAPGYNPATGNWAPFPGWIAQTAANVGFIGVLMRQIRINVTSYTSGTITWQYVQLLP